MNQFFKITHKIADTSDCLMKIGPFHYIICQFSSTKFLFLIALKRVCINSKEQLY